jgi:hypothetical protein
LHRLRKRRWTRRNRRKWKEKWNAADKHLTSFNTDKYFVPAQELLFCSKSANG